MIYVLLHRSVYPSRLSTFEFLFPSLTPEEGGTVTYNCARLSASPRMIYNLIPDLKLPHYTQVRAFLLKAEPNPSLGPNDFVSFLAATHDSLMRRVIQLKGLVGEM